MDLIPDFALETWVLLATSLVLLYLTRISKSWKSFTTWT
uniref:Cytochrome P450 family 3 subfamily A member 5 n=1 Tax=Propithecus coquereli TaxID=379532 RepID=A0A2K6G7G1_PROCO